MKGAALINKPTERELQAAAAKYSRPTLWRSETR